MITMVGSSLVPRFSSKHALTHESLGMMLSTVNACFAVIYCNYSLWDCRLQDVSDQDWELLYSVILHGFTSAYTLTAWLSMQLMHELHTIISWYSKLVL